MEDSERRTKRSRFDQTEPEPKKSRFDRRSRSPPSRRSETRERSPAKDDTEPKKPAVDAAAAAGTMRAPFQFTCLLACPANSQSQPPPRRESMPSCRLAKASSTSMSLPSSPRPAPIPPTPRLRPPQAAPTMAARPRLLPTSTARCTSPTETISKTLRSTTCETDTS